MHRAELGAAIKDIAGLRSPLTVLSHSLTLVFKAFARFNLPQPKFWIVLLPDGQKIYWPMHFYEALWTSMVDVYGRREYCRLNSFIPGREDVVIDVGAHVGLYSLLASRTCGTVFAVEPEPRMFGLLQNNLKLNAKKNVFPLKVALGRRGGSTRFFVPRSTTGATMHLQHLGNQGVTDYTEIEVSIRTLDELITESGIAGVDVLKIDVEGSELDVLAGGSRSLSNGTITKMIVEIHKTVIRPGDVLDFVASFGFRLAGYFDASKFKALAYLELER